MGVRKSAILTRSREPSQFPSIVNSHPVTGSEYVVEIVVVKASGNNAILQLSIAWPQHIQSKAVISTRFQETSTSRENWFGTRGSEVQILSPRPLKINHLH
jgi:hypothetical protein